MTVLDQIADQTDRLLRTTRNLGDLDAPSLCTGWTRSHVLNHLARNAEALQRLVRAAVDGSGETMYASTDQRDAEIEAGVGRDAAALLADVADTATALAPELARLTPELADVSLERTPGGPRFKAGDVPRMRLREVVFHHVDLDAGFGFGDLDSDLLLGLLDEQVTRLRSDPRAPSMVIRTEEGDAWSIGDAWSHVSGSRAGVLLWLARQVTAGVTADHLPSLPAGV